MASRGVWGKGYYTGYGMGHTAGLKTGGLVGIAAVGGIAAYQNREKIKEEIIVVRDEIIDFRDKLADKIDEWLGQHKINDKIDEWLGQLF